MKEDIEKTAYDILQIIQSDFWNDVRFGETQEKIIKKYHLEDKIYEETLKRNPKALTCEHCGKLLISFNKEERTYYCPCKPDNMKIGIS